MKGEEEERRQAAGEIGQPPLGNWAGARAPASCFLTMSISRLNAFRMASFAICSLAPLRGKTEGGAAVNARRVGDLYGPSGARGARRRAGV